MIEGLIRDIGKRFAPSSGYGLTSVVVGLEEALRAVDGLLSFSVTEAPHNPASLVNVRVIPKDGFESLEEVEHLLAWLWRTVAAGAFQASACTWYHEAMAWRGVAIVEAGHSYVTATFLATGALYAGLISNDGLALDKPLPSLPRVPRPAWLAAFAKQL